MELGFVFLAKLKKIFITKTFIDTRALIRV